MAIFYEVWGQAACFTRPEMKAERVSYEVMTPSAARGILEAIYWHPGIKYVIDRIYIMNPVRFTNIRRNEVRSVIPASAAITALRNEIPFSLYSAEDRQQRASLILQDVHYVIEARFVVTDKANPDDSQEKTYSIIKRRLEKGQCFSQPYFGCREFPAYFREWPGGPIQTISMTQELGFILYDLDYSNHENIRPKFFRAKVVNGVMDVSHRRRSCP